MTIDPENERHIIADDGKEFVRIVSGEHYGKEIYLGYSYYIGGVLQDPPHYDVPEDFEEVEIVDPTVEPDPDPDPDPDPVPVPDPDPVPEV